MCCLDEYSPGAYKTSKVNESGALSEGFFQSARASAARDNQLARNERVLVAAGRTRKL